MYITQTNVDNISPNVTVYFKLNKGTRRKVVICCFLCCYPSCPWVSVDPRDPRAFFSGCEQFKSMCTLNLRLAPLPWLAIAFSDDAEKELSVHEREVPHTQRPHSFSKPGSPTKMQTSVVQSGRKRLGSLCSFPF